MNVSALRNLQYQIRTLRRMTMTPYECYWRDRAFRAEKAIEKILAGEEIPTPEFVHASGESLCERCGLPYCEHGPEPGFPFLKRLCDGKAVKL